MKALTGAEADVARLLQPSSVAVIGASARPGSLSWWPVHLLRSNGFAGSVYPVNPKYDDLDGLRCYPSIAAVGAPVDVAVIVLDADRTIEAVRECAAAGVRAVVLPTQGFAELGEEGRAKEARLLEVAREAGIRVVGTNTDGVANLATGAIMSIQPLFDEGVPTGPVGVVTHSGATAASLLVRLKAAGLGACLHVSAGNESDLGLADYLSVMVQDSRIRILLAFVETIRDPQAFYRVAEQAASLGKPIVLIKVGRSQEGARRASAHTGALAGDDDLYEAVFRRFGVIRVNELGELVAVARLFLAVGTITGDGIGVISGSGGQCGVAADAAKVLDLALPRLRADIEREVDEMLAFGAGFNPCDVTGEIARIPTLAADVYRRFSRDPAIALVVFIRKKMLADVSERSVRPLVEAAGESGATPLAVYAMDGFVRGVEQEIYDGAATPVFMSLHELYVAARGLLARDRALAASGRPSTTSIVRQPLPGSLTAGRAVSEKDSRVLHEAYDLPVPSEAFASDADGAAVVAETIGFPVVVKVSDPRIQHKTEMGGVVLDLADSGAVRVAAAEVLRRAAEALGGEQPEGVVVQEQVRGGVEMIAGIKVDPDLGPFVLVGLGGVTAELVQDVSIRMAPVSEAEAHEMVDELRGSALLHGFRGAPAADVGALAAAVSRLSRLAVDGTDVLAEVDLNPVVVLEQGRGVRVLDSLFVTAEVRR